MMLFKYRCTTVLAIILRYLVSKVGLEWEAQYFWEQGDYKFNKIPNLCEVHNNIEIREDGFFTKIAI